MDALIFLLKLAYESRYRLPMLLTVGFMVLDIRMQLEINIHTRQVRRQRRPGGRTNRAEQDRGRNRESEASNDSWMTLEEYDEQLGDDTETEVEQEVQGPIEQHQEVPQTSVPGGDQLPSQDQSVSYNTQVPD